MSTVIKENSYGLVGKNERGEAPAISVQIDRVSILQSI